jgi:hypothetical protein
MHHCQIEEVDEFSIMVRQHILCLQCVTAVYILSIYLDLFGFI